ncbi:hypothetical protein HMPREF1430_00241 [Helicobacter pylori GAM96Ai]|uniref:hypothetical protein n=1 Tax=Helicobacter pylori TaxID=210 RepID=UPI0002BA65FC|nr:hypothetical protein [Helicobacter pylori]EMH44826.1 hypothetical protein HMPREF1430_00241 [Helicobacter pylori GAM96Ai]
MNKNNHLKWILWGLILCASFVAFAEEKTKEISGKKATNDPSGRVYTGLDFDSFKATIKDLENKNIKFQEINPNIIKDSVFDYAIVNNVLKRIKDLNHYDPIIEKILDGDNKEVGFNITLQINPEIKDFFTFKNISTKHRQRCFLSLSGDTREIVCDDKLYNALLAVFNSYNPNDLLEHMSAIETLKKVFYTIKCQAFYL